MIDYEFGDDAQIPFMRSLQKPAEIFERAKIRINIEIIGNVVSVVAQRRGIERQQPNGSDPEFMEIIQLVDEPAKIAHAVTVAVAKGLDVQLVNDGVLIPERIHSCLRLPLHHAFNL